MTASDSKNAKSLGSATKHGVNVILVPAHYGHFPSMPTPAKITAADELTTCEVAIVSAITLIHSLLIRRRARRFPSQRGLHGGFRVGKMVIVITLTAAQMSIGRQMLITFYGCRIIHGLHRVALTSNFSDDIAFLGLFMSACVGVLVGMTSTLS